LQGAVECAGVAAERLRVAVVVAIFFVEPSGRVVFAIIAEGKLRQALRQRREVMLREQGAAPEGKRVAAVATAAKRGEDGIAVHLQRGADLYRCLRFACGEFARVFYDEVATRLGVGGKRVICAGRGEGEQAGGEDEDFLHAV